MSERMNPEMAKEWKAAREAWAGDAQAEISSLELPAWAANLLLRGAMRSLDSALNTAESKSDALNEGLPSLQELGTSDGRQGSRQIALESLARTLAAIGAAISDEDMTASVAIMSGKAADIRAHVAGLREQYKVTD